MANVVVEPKVIVLDGKATMQRTGLVCRVTGDNRVVITSHCGKVSWSLDHKKDTVNGEKSVSLEALFDSIRVLRIGGGNESEGVAKEWVEDNFIPKSTLKEEATAGSTVKRTNLGNVNTNLAEFPENAVPLFQMASILNGFVTSVLYDPSTLTVTFKRKDLTDVNVNLPVEMLISNVVLDGSDLEFTFQDEHVVTIPLNTLLVGVAKSANGKLADTNGSINLELTDFPDIVAAFAGKAPVNHTHTISQIAGLQDSLESIETGVYKHRGNVSPAILAVRHELPSLHSIPKEVITVIPFSLGYDIYGIKSGNSYIMPSWASHARITGIVNIAPLANNAVMACRVMKNGGIVARSTATGSGNATYPATTLDTGIMKITTGDSFLIDVWHDDPSAKNLSPTLTFINVELYESI